MEFYNVKTREKLEIPESDLKKRVMVQKSGKRTYAVTAEKDGVKLFRFVSKQQFETLNAPEI